LLRAFYLRTSTGTFGQFIQSPPGIPHRDFFLQAFFLWEFPPGIKIRGARRKCQMLGGNAERKCPEEIQRGNAGRKCPEGYFEKLVSVKSKKSKISLD